MNFLLIAILLHGCDKAVKKDDGAVCLRIWMGEKYWAIPELAVISAKMK